MREVTTTSTAEVGKLKKDGYVIAGIVYFAPGGDPLFTLRKGSEE